MPDEPGAAHCSITESFPSFPLKRTVFHFLKSPMMRPICADHDHTGGTTGMSIHLGKSFSGDKISRSLWLGLALQI